MVFARNKIFFTVGFAAFLLATLSFVPAPAFAKEAPPAIKDAGYAAAYVAQSIADPVQLNPGETKTITFTFKNTGTATWDANSGRFISAYTMEPRYHTSLLRGPSWLDGKQTAKISGTVKPGQTGQLQLDVTAPKTPGLYTEYFHLAAESYTWVKGGGFFLKIQVLSKAEKQALDEDEGPVVLGEPPASPYTPHRFLLEPARVSAKGGERVEILVSYQNLDATPWTSYGFTVKSPTTLATIPKFAFADELWHGPTTLVKKEAEVAPGAVFTEKLVIRAPRKAGAYTADIQFEVNGTPVESAALHIPVTVTEHAPDYVDGEDIGFMSMPRFEKEPVIRVGLWKVDNKERQVQFVSDEEYGVYTNGAQVGNILPGVKAVLGWNGSAYTLATPELALSSQEYFRLVPVSNPSAVFTILNLERKLAWKGPRNFNKYRGVMEFRFTRDGKDLYVIEELPFEDYIAGIGETSAIAPMEYIKAILVASRTYGYYIMEHTDKHDKRNFDVVAHTGDQLYLGVVSEEMMPRVVEAARETRGYMITHEGKIVVTPYFGNSDGRTRSWTEVWGGTAKPWLVPVVATYDKRDKRKKYGHGVGMSARDAAYRAEEEGVDWTSLIKYYYTGVDVERVYN